MYRKLIGMLRWRFWSVRILRRATKGSIPLGKAAEDLAALYLERLGYRIVARNFQSQSGEIDLIATCGHKLVFVEVKSRRSPARESPERNVSRRKQTKIRAVARDYVTRHELGDPRIEFRFDVIAILWPRQGEGIVVRHIPSAFPVSCSRGDALI